MITWPALLKLKGDDELVFVENQQAWDVDSGSHAASYQAEDWLIDSTGAIFTLCSSNGAEIVATTEPSYLELNAVIELIKRHQSQLGSCCAAKLYFPSIHEAILSLEVND